MASKLVFENLHINNSLTGIKIFTLKHIVLIHSVKQALIATSTNATMSSFSGKCTLEMC